MPLKSSVIKRIDADFRRHFGGDASWRCRFSVAFRRMLVCRPLSSVSRRPPDEKGWGPLFWSMPVGFTWAGWFAAWWCALEFYILLVQTNTLGRQALTYGSTECHLDLLMPWLNLTPNYYRSQDKLFTDGRSCCS